MTMGSTLLALPWLAVPLCAAIVGCGSKPSPVVAPPEATATEAAVPTSAPSTEATTAPAASAAPSDRPASGRPAVTTETSSGKISSTFGATPASILKLNIKEAKEPAVLEIPEWALPTGYNITWQTAKSAAAKKAVGPVFQIIVQEAREGESRPTRVDSGGPPFKLRFPLFGKKTLNLAVGEIQINEETGKESVTWTVFAPTKVEEGLGEVIFELPSLGFTYLHATTADPGTVPAPEPKKK
jgi:hypothetical protein